MGDVEPSASAGGYSKSRKGGGFDGHSGGIPPGVCRLGGRGQYSHRERHREEGHAGQRPVAEADDLQVSPSILQGDAGGDGPCRSSLLSLCGAAERGLGGCDCDGADGPVLKRLMSQMSL